MPLESLLLALGDPLDQNRVFAVSPTGEVLPIRLTYFMAADANDPLIRHVCLNRPAAERKALEVRGLGDAIQRPWKD